MKKNLQDINLNQSLTKAKDFLRDDTKCSEEAKVIFTPILMAVEAILQKHGTNSKNSSIPPSQDPNREKNLQSDQDNGQVKKKPGGQPGRTGKTLTQFERVDEVIEVPVNRDDLPSGHEYRSVGHEPRQVVEIIFKRHVKEFRLEVVCDEDGKYYTAKAPEGVNSSIQYGASVKTQAAYMYAFQMIPYARIEDYFEHGDISISSGTIFNINNQAYDLLESFEATAKLKLRTAVTMHNDETSINIGGKKFWLHNASNQDWVLYGMHKKRGVEAMNAMDILPHFRGVSIHDHWKPYYCYEKCLHALCNSHHLRELKWVVEKFPEHTWAKKMRCFLQNLNSLVDQMGGILDEESQQKQIEAYREILVIAEAECPAPPPHPEPAAGEKKKRGKVPKGKERNLIERLRNFEDDVLRFMTNKDVPFTNNQGERDVRMVKVQQKVSGCFRSEEGAKIFCRIRSYILTCQRHGIKAMEGLAMLFQGRLPDFCST